MLAKRVLQFMWRIAPIGDWNRVMLSRETIEEYRRMTPGQRLRLTLDAIEASTPYLSKGPPEVVARRFELIQRENDLRNENILRALRRARDRHEED
jgi:hypothetical protein